VWEKENSGGGGGGLIIDDLCRTIIFYIIPFTIPFLLDVSYFSQLEFLYISLKRQEELFLSSSD